MEQLNRTVEQILAFARTAEPVLVRTSLNAVVDDLGLLVRHKLKNQGIQFVPELDANQPHVLADSAQLSQALLNLVLNAVDAMPDGGTMTIRTGLARAKTPLGFIELADTGAGLPEELQNKAFRSLLQTSKKHGTGLGLAIVGRIIEAHQGQIEVKSQPGRGTLFRILLPLAGEDQPPASV
jgi:signal transduction histidine kinase